MDGECHGLPVEVATIAGLLVGGLAVGLDLPPRRLFLLCMTPLLGAVAAATTNPCAEPTRPGLTGRT